MDSILGHAIAATCFVAALLTVGVLFFLLP